MPIYHVAEGDPRGSLFAVQHVITVEQYCYFFAWNNCDILDIGD